MAAPKKSKKGRDRKPRRSQAVPLTPDQIKALITIWRGPEGIRAFAARMAEEERPHDMDDHTENVLKNLYRIEDGTQGITQWRFETIAKVLKITPKQLNERLASPTPSAAQFGASGPWITDETVLAEYRRTYYGYYFTKQGKEYFWMHHKIDFSKHYPGCLHATMNYGIKRPIYYKVYAYIFREMMVAITQCVTDPEQLESVAIYHDFCRRTREDVGYFSIRVNEDWNGDFGAGASLMFREPFAGTKKEGRQSPAICEKLTEHWKQQGGERCNRLLNLFGFGPFSSSASFETTPKNGANSSVKRPKRRKSK